MNTETYNILNLIINALTSLGTLGAVVTALYLAKKQNAPQIQVSADIVYVGNENGHEEFICTRATNVGIMSEYIESVGYELGFLKWGRALYVVPSPHDFGKNVPSAIEPGENVANYVRTDVFIEKQISGMNEALSEILDEIPLPNFIKSQQWFMKCIIRSAKCCVSSSRGGVVKSYVRLPLRNLITKEMKAHS